MNTYRDCRFPAMEDMISKMSKNDLLVLSGFLTTCVDKYARDVYESISAAQDLIRDCDSPVANRLSIDIIKHSTESVLAGTHNISQLIRKRLQQLNEIDLSEAGERHDNQLREILRWAFPGIEIRS